MQSVVQSVTQHIHSLLHLHFLGMQYITTTPRCRRTSNRGSGWSYSRTDPRHHFTCYIPSTATYSGVAKVR